MHDDEISKLDLWEDVEYERIEIEVLSQCSVQGKQQIRAFAYNWNGSADTLYGSWSYELDFLPIEDKFVTENCEP